MITAKTLGLVSVEPAAQTGRGRVRAERARQLETVRGQLVEARRLYAAAQAGDGDLDLFDAGRLVRELEGQEAELAGALRVHDEQDAEARRAIAEAEQEAAQAAAEEARRRAVAALPAADAAFLAAVDRLVARAAKGVADGAALGEARRQLDEAYTRAGQVPATLAESLRQRSRAHGALWMASGEGWRPSCRALVDVAEDPRTQDPAVEHDRQIQAQHRDRASRQAEESARWERARRANEMAEVHGRPPAAAFAPIVGAGVDV